MLVKFLDTIMGNPTAAKGEVKDIPDAMAQKLIRANICQPWVDTPIENEAPEPETTVIITGKGRRGGRQPKVNTR